MQHWTIHTRNVNYYIDELNNLTGKGAHVISAGAEINPATLAIEWWAILQKGDEAQQKPEAPKDEAAELLAAARKIARHCLKTERCVDCLLFNREEDVCAVSDMPNYLDVEWGADDV